jgi:hypothetical protein
MESPLALQAYFPNLEVILENKYFFSAHSANNRPESLDTNKNFYPVFKREI